ncbi:MAG: SMP-30/gluconolactonase/LRE family protein [Bdellovibrionota bacterium]
MVAFSFLVSSIALIGSGLYPESLAYRPSTQTLYVGGDGDGSIQTVSRDGKSALLQQPGTDGREGTLGVKIDEERDRLWVVDVKTVSIYTLSTNTLLRKAALSEAAQVAKPGLNDLAIDPKTGDAYITDSFNPSIYRVSGVSLALSKWRDVSTVPFNEQDGVAYNLNGIVFSPDLKSLISVKTNDGTLWNIPLDGSEISQIPTTALLLRGDGLAWGKGQQLYVARNFVNKISVVDFSLERAIKPVMDLEVPGLGNPTGIAFVDGESPAIFVTNSQFWADSPVLPFTLSRVEISPFHPSQAVP